MTIGGDRNNKNVPTLNFKGRERHLSIVGERYLWEKYSISNTLSEKERSWKESARDKWKKIQVTRNQAMRNDRKLCDSSSKSKTYWSFSHSFF